MNEGTKARQDIRAFQESIRYHIKYSAGRTWDQAPGPDRYKAVALAIRDRLVDGMLATGFIGTVERDSP